ncbi:MAG: hypothetical protein ACLVI9_07590, partial [Anaerostipes hadrus]
ILSYISLKVYTNFGILPIFSYFRPFMMENRYPITKPNKTLDPTLSKMLPIGLPLYSGENILSSDTT